jgi:hypothetical protein
MSKNGLSRRTFLKGVGAGGGALALSQVMFGLPVALAQEMADDDTQTIINLASTAELLAVTHYWNAINGSMDISADLGYFKAALIAEKDHYDLLVSLGAQPVVTEFYYPNGVFDDIATFAAVTEVAETAFVGAYLAATRIFANAGATPFAVTTAQIAAVEESHRNFVRGLGGLLPNNVSYAPYSISNVSEAVPVLTPFLDGSGEGFTGPFAPPSDDDINAFRTELGDAFDTSAIPFAAMEM